MADPPEMLRRLRRYVVLVSKGKVKIRDAAERIVTLRLNRAQQVVLAAMLRQAAGNKPIRLTILKSRKVGISTLVQTVYAVIGAVCDNQRLKLVAHRDESTREIFEIAKRAANRLDVRPCDALGTIIRWPDSDSKLHAMTAGGENVGAGETPNAIHASEVAKWKLNKEETWINLWDSLPKTPTSIGVVESTAVGRELFFNHWEDSRDPASEYEAIFIPWYIDDTLAVPVSGKLHLDAEEQALIRRAAENGYEISAEMFAWRRAKIREIGADAFRQEYPSTPAEAVQASAGLILPRLRDCVTDVLPSSAPNIGGIDFGYYDPTVILAGTESGGRLTITHLYREPGGIAREQARELLPGCTYYCDPANVQERRELQEAAEDCHMRADLRAAPRTRGPGEDVSVTEMRKLARFVDEGRLLIHRSVAEQFIIEADNLAWHPTSGRVDDRRIAKCGHFDTLYALKYCVLGLDHVGAVPEFAVASRPSRAQQLRAL